MTQAAELLQASIRAQTGTANSHLEDWHSLFDLEGIAAGPFNERQLAWLNGRMGTAHRTLADARHAFALTQSETQWSELNEIPPADTRVSLNFINENFAVHDGSKMVGYSIDNLPGSSFARNSPAWGFAISGGNIVLKEFANDEPRFVVDPVTGVKVGYRSELSETRLTDDPLTPFDGWTLISDATRSLEPGTLLERFSNICRVKSSGSLVDLIRPAPFSLTQGISVTFSAIYKAGTSGLVYLRIYRALPTGTFSSLVGVPGLVSINSQSAGNIAEFEEEYIGDGWYLANGIFTPNTTETHYFYIGPYSAAIGEDVVVAGGLVQTGKKGSWIFDFNPLANITRAKDDWVISNLSSNFPASTATWLLWEGAMPELPELGTIDLLNLSDGTADNRFRLYCDAISGEVRCQLRQSGVTEVILNCSFPPSPGERLAIAAYYGANDSWIYVNGTFCESSSSTSLPSVAFTDLDIMQRENGSNQPNTTVSRIIAGVGVKEQSWGSAISA